MATRLNNSVVDERLIADNRPITRVGEYTTSATKMEWKCVTCGHQWHATTNSVLNLKSGCPKCYGNTKYTNADIDRIISGRNIKRKGNYINFDTPIDWECEIWGHTWTASPNGILTKSSGCPVCSALTAGKRKSGSQETRVKTLLDDKQIRTKQPYKKITDRYDFVCDVCNHEWQTTLNCVVNNGSGCPCCAGLVKLTDADIDNRLVKENRPITRVGSYINATTKIKWQCHKCEGVWEATPDSVLNHSKSGCAICGTLGVLSKKYFTRNPHKKHIPGYVYLIEGEYNGLRFLKVGITEHTVEKRFSGDAKRYNIKMIHAKQTTLYEAYAIEQMLLNRHIKHLLVPDKTFDGKTECLKYDEGIKRDIISTLMG